MSLDQRLGRVEGALCPESDLRDGLRALMRFLLVHRRLATVVPFGHKTRGQMTPEEWREFRRGSVACFDSREGQRMFGGESKMRAYVCLGGAQLDDEELREVAAVLSAQPDAADYFY